MNEVNKPSPKPFAQFIPAILIAIVVFLDQLSKYWVVNKLNLDRIGSIDLKSFFDLTMVWNYGVSFGIFRANSDFGRWALVGFTGIISIFFFFWLLRAPNRLSQIALSLIIGGAMGNMIDRIRFGAVADFLDFTPSFPWFPWVFNIADSAVVLGAALLALELFIGNEENKNLPNNNVESN